LILKSSLPQFINKPFYLDKEPLYRFGIVSVDKDKPGCLGAHKRFWDIQVSQNRIASLGVYSFGRHGSLADCFDENYAFFYAT